MGILEKVYEVMNQLTCDAILISNRHSMRYITGYCGDTGIAVITKTSKVIFTDFRYVYQAQAEAKEYEVKDIDQVGYAKCIAELLKKDDVKCAAFDEEETSYVTYSKYVNEFGEIKLIPYSNQLDALRMVKTEQELEYIKEAERIGDIVFEKILEEIKPGVTELEIAAKIEYLLKTNGAEGISFAPIVASGINSSMPHAVPSHKKIEVGDFLTMDFGCIYHGYCSDMTRTIVVGKASEEQKKIYNTVLKAQLAVLDQLKAGMQGKAVDKIARDIIYDAGYEGCFGHGLGHSVGLFIHESPRASMKAEEIIGENMTITVEPGIYVKDFGGVRIEDLCVVTKDGCINFTHSPKELIELDF
ncbi:MAG: aminopeptidase P family protein [Clostridiales bacterium]|nr:aminopeptidase P family protein [Clostridiales bacterium]